jgi:hypothetical protein
LVFQTALGAMQSFKVRQYITDKEIYHR